MMESKWMKRIVCVLVTITLFAQMVPIGVMASEPANSEITNNSSAQVGAEILREEPSRRDESEKHFLLTDGTYLAVSYGLPVHYQDETGGWQDIDNRLTLVNRQGVAVYETASNPSSTAFAATLADGRILSSGVGDTSVSMYLLDTIPTNQMSANAQAGLVTNDDVVAFDRTAEAVVITNDDAAAFSNTVQQDNPGWDMQDVMPENLESSILYEDVFPGVDLLYTAYSHNIKEQIIVNVPQTEYRYHFMLKLDNLTAVQNQDGSIFLNDESGDLVYYIPAPFMEDADGAYSENVTYALDQIADGIILTVEADASWINAEDRQFPVAIDPTLFSEKQATHGDREVPFFSGYVAEGEPNLAHGSTQNIFAGYSSYTSSNTGNPLKQMEIFTHFREMPSIPNGSIVVDAQYSIYQNNYSSKGCSQLDVAIHEVTSACWEEFSYFSWLRNITWNSKPTYNSGNMIDYVTLSSSTKDTRVCWDITELVKKWYNEGTPNRTIAIVAVDGGRYSNSSYAYAGFRSYGINNHPTLIISYRSSIGVEPYYTYTSVNGGQAGTAYIADATGQLKTVKNVASYASTVNPFALNLVYNSDYFQSNAVPVSEPNEPGSSLVTQVDDYQPPSELGLSMQIGSGWTLDVIQRVVPDETLTDYDYLRYYDGDGTIHYFYKNTSDSTYYDEDGLGLKITGSNGSYTMSDEKDNKWIFTNSYLTKMEDNNGNQYMITYESGKLTKIEQKNAGCSAITVATFGYSGNYLSTITDAAGIVTTLTYTNGKLTGIKRGSTTIAGYAYSGYQLIQLTDVLDGDKVKFEYNDDGRVKTYFWEASNGAKGATVSVDYPNISKTIYRTNNYTDSADDDIYTYYLFDNAGHTVNAYVTDASNNILGASNAVYTETQTASKKNNRTERLASMGVAGQQLMRNSSFESSNTDASIVWTLGSGCSISEEKHRTGYKSLKGSLTNASGTASATKTSQTLSKNTTYTLSAYINTSNVNAFSGDGVYLRVTDPTGKVWNSPKVNYKTSDAIEDGWVRISVTFTATSDGTHTIGVYGTGLTGAFYVDDLQLEKGEAPSNRNLLSNGSMEYSYQEWWFGNSDQMAFASGVGLNGSGAIKITGKPNLSNTHAYQNVILNLPGTETYVLSGWVKANSVTNAAEGKTNRTCGLRAVITYSDNTTETHSVSFNTDIAEWQFVSTTIVPEKPEKTVSKMQVYCAYEKNANVAYFDNISLVREIAQTMAYDTEGNLISVTSTGLSEETSQYQEGNLIKAVTGSNGTYDYTYHDEYKHRLTSVTNSLVTQTYGYDSVGNVTSTTLAPNGGGKKLQTSATYTNNKNLTASITDAAGNTTSYAYGNNLSKMLGAPTSTTNAKGVTGTTVYDNFGRITQTAVANKAKLVYSYSGNKLMGITRTDLATSKAQSYTFGYDGLGRTTSVSVGSRTLATYAYDGNKDLLLTQTYGNGHAVSFTYDDLGRTKTAAYSDGRVLTYTYTGDGLLHSIDVDGGPAPATYLYSYDTLGRLISSEMRDGSGNMILRTHQTYNEKNQLVGQSWQLGNTGFGETYEYNEADGSLKAMSSATGRTLQMGYDALRRLTSVNAGIYTRTYTYRDISTTQTTTQISSVSYSGLTNNPTYGYTYDALGNIATYTAPDGEVITYTYDDQGQLLSAVGDQTYTYTYDNVGNILTANGHTFTYGDSTWRDLLTKFDGQTISYDNIGNPTSYYNGTRWAFTWNNGRQLVNASSESDLEDVNISYVYDADGVRTSKTVTTKTYHIHNYTAVTTPPTCTAVGYTTHTCACGDSYQSNETAATGHTYTTTVIAPTCTEIGYTLNTCHCGDSYQTNETEALGHDLETNNTQVGIIHSCTRCDYSYSEHTHSYTTTVKEATCREAGYTLHECDCGYSYQSDAVPALGHDLVGTPAGDSIFYYCLRCHYSYDEFLSLRPGDDVVVASASAELQTTNAATTAVNSEDRILMSTVTESHSYIYGSGKLLREIITTTVDGDTPTVQVLDFFYDEAGRPFAVEIDDVLYYYITNLQGDVMQIVDSNGATVATYDYDPYGNIISSTGSIAEVNPLRYRGYIYDTETGLYYVSSRYYDPEIGRWINADDVDYLGAGSNLTSYNLFAYCGNNPVMGYDPTGHWDWGGVIAGLGIIAGTVITVATFGIGSPIGAIIAGAAITTGAVTTYAAATDSTMVVDLSYSKQVLPNYYVKGGGSVVIDFKNDNANFYPHIGFGKGYSDGLSYSVGMVDNYEHPDDYAKHFIDINVGYNAGFDHCWNPLEKHDSATQATAVTFSSGGSYGVGYDYYFGPKQILAW